MINIMNEYTAFTKRCLNSYMKFILDKQYDKGIVNRYIDKYIEIRYSNYLDENTIKDTLAKKITKGITYMMKERTMVIPAATQLERSSSCSGLSPILRMDVIIMESCSESMALIILILMPV